MTLAGVVVLLGIVAVLALGSPGAPPRTFWLGSSSIGLHASPDGEPIAAAWEVGSASGDLLGSPRLIVPRPSSLRVWVERARRRVLGTPIPGQLERLQEGVPYVVVRRLETPTRTWTYCAADPDDLPEEGRCPAALVGAWDLPLERGGPRTIVLGADGAFTDDGRAPSSAGRWGACGDSVLLRYDADPPPAPPGYVSLPSIEASVGIRDDAHDELTLVVFRNESRANCTFRRRP